MLSLAGIAGLIIFCSVGTVFKYFGFPGAILYSLTVPALVFYSRRFPIKISFRILLIFLFLLGVIFMLVYPSMQSGDPERGSDRDEDLNISVQALFSGEPLSGVTTYLGNPVVSLPGAVLLASPFVLLLGNSAYQNFFWLMAYFWVFAGFFSDKKRWYAACAALLILNPEVLRELMTGGSFLANSIYIVLAVILFYRSMKSGILLGCLGSSLFLALALCSRLHFALVFPVLALYSYRTAGFKRSALWLGVTLFFYVLCMSFNYRNEPDLLFTTLQTGDLLTGWWSWESSSLLAVIFITSLSLLWRAGLHRQNSPKHLLYASAFVLLFPVLLVVLPRGLSGYEATWKFFGYGLSFLFFAYPAFCIDVLNDDAYNSI